MSFSLSLSLSTLSLSWLHEKADPGQADTQRHGTTDPLVDVEKDDLLEGVVWLAQHGLEPLVVGDILD